MKIARNQKVVLKKEFNGFENIGQEFEVASITDTFVVLRNPINKIAVLSIDFNEFYEYFGEAVPDSSWTKWTQFVNSDGDVIGYYRTNYKKVQVRNAVPPIVSNMDKPKVYRAEASCYKTDTFSLFFGIQLAYWRMLKKYYCDVFDNGLHNIQKVSEILDDIGSNIKKLITNSEFIK